MLRHRILPSLLLLPCALTNEVVPSQQQQPMQQQSQHLQLGAVLHSMFDRDKDEKVTMKEVADQLVMVGMLLANNAGEEGDEYRRQLASVQAAAPTLFDLLDANGDAALTMKEMLYATHFERSFKKDGGMEDLVTFVFKILDSDGDGQLSVDELLEGSQSGDVIARVSDLFHTLFPLRDTPQEMEEFVQAAMTWIVGTDLNKQSVGTYTAWLDDDGDGQIQLEEASKQYDITSTKILFIAKTVKEMAPMMAMIVDMQKQKGGGGAGGGSMMEL